jgi:hypothetical protein
MKFPKPLLLLSSLILLLVVQALTPLNAETFAYPDKGDSKFKIQIPDNWKIEKNKEDKEDSFSFTSPSGAIKVILKTVKGDEDRGLNKLVAETEVALKYDVKNPAIAQGRLGGLPMPFVPIKLNNMAAATQLNAKGLSPKDDKPIALYFLIFSPDKERLWGWLYGIYSESTPKQEQEDFFKLVGSVTAG